MTRTLICFVLAVGECAWGQTCPALADEARSRVSAYVADRYNLAPDLKVEDEGVVVGSCFRRIAIRAAAPSRPLELFLSPDQRFLFETLFDTTVSPTAERRRVAHETQLALRSDKSPALGPESAPITLVEFSDFQCPYCRRFAELLDRLPAKDRQRLNVVFKQRPLAIHQWARRAALASVCASFESDEAFWSLEKFLFASQDTITPANLEDRIAAFAKESGDLNFGRMRGCLAEEKAEEILVRDEKMAGLYHIDAVPTVFVNGVRALGFRSVEELQAALNAAAANSPSGPAAESSGDTRAASQ